MRSEKGQELHRQAEQTREAGKFEKSVQLAQEAIQTYEADKDFLGQSDAYGSLSLSFRHLNKLNEAEDAALKGIKIAEDHNLQGDRARPYFNLAKVQEQRGKLDDAVESYKRSIQIFQRENPILHNRSGVLADMNIHLATCEYKAGNKSALDRALTAITDLKNSDEEKVSKYNYDVWISGGHMKIADMLREDDLEEAKKHLQIAKEIIDADPELVIRKDQWEKISKSF